MRSGNSSSPSDGFRLADRRAGVGLAAHNFNVFSHELPLATVQIPRNGELMAVALVAATSEIGTSCRRCFDQCPLRADGVEEVLFR